MLLLEKLRSNNFDFEQLPKDVHNAAKIVLTNNVCPQIEVLDQTTFEIIAKLNPANPSVTEVVKIMKAEPENDGFNTRISENKFENGGILSSEQIEGYKKEMQEAERIYNENVNVENKVSFGVNEKSDRTFAKADSVSPKYIAIADYLENGLKLKGYQYASYTMAGSGTIYVKKNGTGTGETVRIADHIGRGGIFSVKYDISTLEEAKWVLEQIPDFAVVEENNRIERENNNIKHEKRLAYFDKLKDAGYAFGELARTYQKPEIFIEKHPDYVDIKITELGTVKTGDMAYKYEFLKPFDGYATMLPDNYIEWHKQNGTIKVNSQQFAKGGKTSTENTNFIYGTKFFVPPGYGEQIVETLKSFYGFDVEWYKPDVIIVSKNNKKLLVNDNGGEFNLVEFNAENNKFEEHVSNIPYDITTGIVPPEVLAANIYFDFVDYFELPNDFMQQAIEVNTKIEAAKPDDWTKTLMKNRAVKKAIFTITQNVDLTEIIYVIIYRYTINGEELPKPALKNPFTSTIKKEEFTKLVNNFENFVPALQRKYLLDVFKGEEKELAIDIARRLYDIFNRMPKTYETENTPKERKVLWLHYFYSGSDWYIMEKDMYPDQSQAFGYAILNGDTENAEMGYISITELMSIRGVELDFYFTPITFGELFKEEIELQLTNQQEKLLYEAQLTDSYVELQKSNFEANFKPLEAAGIIYTTPSLNRQNVDVYLTDKGKDFVANYRFKKENKVTLPQPVVIEEKKYTYFKGTQHSYENPFTLNKAIEELVDELTPQSITPEQKTFISYYSGYGGLEKFGATGKGLLYEYFTPTDIVKKMWGLAYKHGYKGGPLLEPSVGVGEFIKFAPAQEIVTAYEINPYSAKICRLLFPNITLVEQPFETMFIKNRESIKNKLMALKKFDLVIGNPPYGDFQGIYAGMGEKAFTHAENYIDYFISRGLDALNKNGLLIFIVGTEVAAGGKPFLQKPITKAKAEIAKKSVLLDAYRLPNGVFERTDVLSDIIVLQKL